MAKGVEILFDQKAEVISKTEGDVEFLASYKRTKI
jgi:hypothetical protein